MKIFYRWIKIHKISLLITDCGTIPETYLVFSRMLNGPVFVSSFRVADVANEIYVCILGTQDFHVHKNFDIVYFYFVFTILYVLCR
jgi:hypothetical protein